MKLHLHQYLSKSGLFPTKQDLNSAVSSGAVRIDDKVTTNPMFRFNPEKRKVYFDGKEVSVVETKVYFLMHKPMGYVSGNVRGNEHTLGKKSIYDLLRIDKKIKNSLFCVGRLDEDTSGLIILTNDGKLGYRITNPKSKIEKRYKAVLKNPLSKKSQDKILAGLKIRLQIENRIVEHFAKPDSLVMTGENTCIIALIEGKKREVRKIFEAVSNPVVSLCRVSIGRIVLDDLGLKAGEFRAVEKNYILERI
jgi:pseudouridine synthase